MTNITSSYTIKVYSVIMQSHYLDQPSERFAKGGGVVSKKGPVREGVTGDKGCVENPSFQG